MSEEALMSENGQVVNGSSSSVTQRTLRQFETVCSKWPAEFKAVFNEDRFFVVRAERLDDVDGDVDQLLATDIHKIIPANFVVA